MTEDTLRTLLKSLTWTLNVKPRENGKIYYLAVKKHYRNIYLSSLAGLARLTEETVREKIRRAVRL